MSGVISRSEAGAANAPAPSTAPVHGRGDVSFVRDGNRSVLGRLYQKDPVRILFPGVPVGELPMGVLVTTSGGLVGGDVIEVSAETGAGARAILTSQAAEKIYRSAGDDCRISVALHAGAGSWLEWLPQETILFDHARLRRITSVHRAPGASVLAGEMAVFGRTAMKETFSSGLLHDRWEVRTGDRLVWADALHLDDDAADALAHPACFDGAIAMGTVIFACDEVDTHLDAARALLEDAADTVRAGASVVGGVLVVRFLSRDAFDLRAAFGDFWAGFRAHAVGLPAFLPRLWHV